MTKKSNEAWAIRNPDGYIPPDNVSLMRKKAISMFIGYASSWSAWKEKRKEGYRCVKVRIEEDAIEQLVRECDALKQENEELRAAVRDLSNVLSRTTENTAPAWLWGAIRDVVSIHAATIAKAREQK